MYSQTDVEVQPDRWITDRQIAGHSNLTEFASCLILLLGDLPTSNF